ncbi:MAG: hypothetical protein GY870_13165, partial [archaeon]|nr:hypothetical protein [archaeon]
MAEFDFGSLLGNDKKSKTPPDKEKKTKKKTKKSEQPKKKRTTVSKPRSRSILDEKKYDIIIKKLDNLEEKINNLSQGNISSVQPQTQFQEQEQIEKQPQSESPSKRRLGQVYITDYTLSQDDVIKELSCPSDNDIKKFAKTKPVDWHFFLGLAKKYRWLHNVYTLSRFFDLLNEEILKTEKRNLFLKKKWSDVKVDRRKFIFKEAGIQWSDLKLKPLKKGAKLAVINV